MDLKQLQESYFHEYVKYKYIHISYIYIYPQQCFTDVIIPRFSTDTESEPANGHSCQAVGACLANFYQLDLMEQQCAQM